jgi:GntR family transcriptional regulator
VLEGDYASNSLREALEENFDIRWTHAKQIIRAMSASRRVADLLSVPARSALLYIERVSYIRPNVPVEFLRIYYRGDRYTLYNELQA